MPRGGKREGAGRKRRDQEEKEKEIIDKATTEEDWLQVFQAQMEEAKTGNTKAAVFVFERRFGKPRQSVDLSADTLIDYVPTWLGKKPLK